jgi:hypothetical protein
MGAMCPSASIGPSAKYNNTILVAFLNSRGRVFLMAFSKKFEVTDGNILKVVSPVIKRHAVWWKSTGVSEEHTAVVVRVED